MSEHNHDHMQHHDESLEAVDEGWAEDDALALVADDKASGKVGLAGSVAE